MPSDRNWLQPVMYKKCHCDHNWDNNDSFECAFGAAACKKIPKKPKKMHHALATRQSIICVEFLYLPGLFQHTNYT
ncbi:hypothetical protein XELAEV_18000095mg [Xenopus laevis]|uniref:Uncharacterized protein n=1 Tax=Xenopus laevis TaxID=8355 RepID=A0A974BPD9_XENLA|nr:hypothetical protein XELAEV_18000095mg [Xenopus laevis]